jgi:hypothetical protein
MWDPSVGIEVRSADDPGSETTAAQAALDCAQQTFSQMEPTQDQTLF